MEGVGLLHPLTHDAVVDSERTAMEARPMAEFLIVLAIVALAICCLTGLSLRANHPMAS